MKLYTFPASLPCRKVHGVAAHAGVELTRIPVDLRAREQHRLDFLDINPMGRVPVLVDGDTVLWESNAIACYIAGKAGSSLWPEGAQRYDILRWLQWEAAHWIRPFGGMLGQIFFAAEPDEEIIERERNNFRILAGVLDGHLATRDVLSGTEPTVAEYAVGVWLGYSSACALPLAEFAHLSRWNERLTALPGWPEVLPPQP